MRSEAPPLLPVFRSRHLAELLTMLLLHPEQEYTQTDLARLVSSPLTTIQREVERLLVAGLVTERRVGPARLIQANQNSRYIRPLTELMTVAFGPHIVIGEEFANIAKVDGVAIYGSWAARYHGQSGPAPNDVDVLVIGQPDRGDVYTAAEHAERRLSVPVNPTLCSPARWQDVEDSFVRQVRSAPMVWVLGADEHEDA